MSFLLGTIPSSLRPQTTPIMNVVHLLLRARKANVVLGAPGWENLGAIRLVGNGITPSCQWGVRGASEQAHQLLSTSVGTPQRVHTAPTGLSSTFPLWRNWTLNCTMGVCQTMASKDWRMSEHAVMDGTPLDIQESIIITITTSILRIKEPSRAARVPTTSIWILTPLTTLDPHHLLGRSAHGPAARSRMKAQAESSPGAEATTANFDSVRNAPQKHLFPLTIKLPNTIIAIYQTLAFSHCFASVLSFSFLFPSFSVVTPACFLSLPVALAMVLRNQVYPVQISISTFFSFSFPYFSNILCMRSSCAIITNNTTPLLIRRFNQEHRYQELKEERKTICK